MKRNLIACTIALGLAAACAEVTPADFNGNAANGGAQLAPPVSVVITPPLPPSPVSTTSLSNGSVTPRPSVSGMAPPPIETGVVGAPPPPAPPSIDDDSGESGDADDA